MEIFKVNQEIKYIYKINREITQVQNIRSRINITSLIDKIVGIDG